MRIVLEIAPQHSTQYADMAATLAEPELRASPAGASVEDAEPVRLGGRDFLLATLATETDLDALGSVPSRLGATSAVHELIDELGGESGPLLRPVEPAYTPFVPLELAEARRYKGKTSEVFTRVLVNVALFAGAFAHRTTERLRVLDPLAGGGTTLFVALALGHDAFGIERTRRDVDTTASFFAAFCREARIPHHATHAAHSDGVVGLGPRGDQRLLVLAEGQHTGPTGCSARSQAARACTRSPATSPRDPARRRGEVARRRGRSGMAIRARPGRRDRARVERDAGPARHARRGARSGGRLRVRDDGPYARLEHRVDRVIKRRDVVVAVREED